MPCRMTGDHGELSMGAISCMQAVVHCERVSHLDLCTLERQSLCESHRQRRWLTCWSYDFGHGSYRKFSALCSWEAILGGISLHAERTKLRGAALFAASLSSASLGAMLECETWHLTWVWEGLLKPWFSMDSISSNSFLKARNHKSHGGGFFVALLRGLPRSFSVFETAATR